MRFFVVEKAVLHVGYSILVINGVKRGFESHAALTCKSESFSLSGIAESNDLLYEYTLKSVFRVCRCYKNPQIRVSS